MEKNAKYFLIRDKHIFFKYNIIKLHKVKIQTEFKCSWNGGIVPSTNLNKIKLPQWYIC